MKKLIMASLVTWHTAVADVSQAPSPLQVSTDNLTETQLLQLLSAEMAYQRDDFQAAIENYIAVARQTQDAEVAARATELAIGVGSLALAREMADIWVAGEPDNLEAQVTRTALALRLPPIEGLSAQLLTIQKLSKELSGTQLYLLFSELSDSKVQQTLLTTLSSLATEQKLTPHSLKALSRIYLELGEPNRAIELTQAALKQLPDDPLLILYAAESMVQTGDLKAATQYIEQESKRLKTALVLRKALIELLLVQEQPARAQQYLTAMLKDNLPAKEHLHLARIAMEERWFDLAERFLSTARQDVESQATAFYYSGRNAELQGKSLAAIQFYRKVHEGPYHVISYLRASLLLHEQDKTGQALDLLSRAQSMTLADDKRLILTQLEMLSDVGRLDDALLLVNAQLEVSPMDLDLQFSQGIILAELEQFEAAIGVLQKVIEVHPNHVDALNALGFLLIDLPQRHAESLGYLTHAMTLEPESPLIMDSMGWLMVKMGRAEEAIPLLEKAYALTPDAEVALHLGEAYWLGNQKEKATEMWRRAVAHDPDNESLIAYINQFISVPIQANQTN